MMMLKNLKGCYERGVAVFVPALTTLALIVIYVLDNRIYV